MFTQMEGLVVDKGITLCDLKGMLDVFVKRIFGEETSTRLRPSFFPFTEPSVEVDVSCFECGGKGCRLCKGTGWIEVLGAGVVNKKVLENCGIDSDEYSGFAFGLGLERIAMLKYGINNIKLLFESDLRFLKQINAPGAFHYSDGSLGMRKILWGCFQKIAIANVLAKYVNAVYSNLQGNSGGALLLASLFFTIEIYCDFSGYSDIAIGVSHLFGIQLMDNFHSPYFSVSVRDFWSRWHISLSTWLRDYIYIPLGGNRCSRGRNYLNLLITFLFSGLWHGASWTFIAWGGIHGIMQIVEKATSGRKKYATCVVWCRRLFVFLFVNFAWIFFRAASFADAWYLIKHVFTVTSFSELI